MRARLGPRLPCEASADWRAVCILLAIVFSIASAVPLSAQVPLATPGPGRPHPVPPRHSPQDYVPPSHGPPRHGPQDYVPPSHGPPRHGPQDYVPPSHGPPRHGPQDYVPPGHGPPRHGPQNYVPPGHDPQGHGDGGGSVDAGSVIILGLLVAIGVLAFIVYWSKREERKKNTGLLLQKSKSCRSRTTGSNTSYQSRRGWLSSSVPFSTREIRRWIKSAH